MIFATIYPFAPDQSRILLILLSLATEFFDGFLARMWKTESKWGALLDPIADKCFVFSVLVVMFYETDLSWWKFLLIGFRDMVVFLGASYLAIKENWRPFFNVRPRILGKVATTFQFILILSVLVLKDFNIWILYSTVGISIAAGIDYLYLLRKNNFYRV